MVQTQTFYNQFGAYTVPASVYVDPGSEAVRNSVPDAPPYFVPGMVNTINVNNGLGFQRYCTAAANAALNSSPAPFEPKYWRFDPAAMKSYYAAVSMNNTGFDEKILPSQFGMPNGIGGPFIP